MQERLQLICLTFSNTNLFIVTYRKICINIADVKQGKKKKIQLNGYLNNGNFFLVSRCPKSGI